MNVNCLCIVHGVCKYDCILWYRRDREECCAVVVGPKNHFYNKYKIYALLPGFSSFHILINSVRHFVEQWFVLLEGRFA